MSFCEENLDAYKMEWFKMYKKSIPKVKAFYYNGTFPFRSFSSHVVEFIFKLANECGIDSTVKYKCAELYDRYLSEYFIQKYRKVDIYNSNKWQNVLKKNKKKCFLRVISCMQLMSKYTPGVPILRMEDIKVILQRAGHVYSKKQIISSEIKVFKIVRYKLNEPSIHTLVECLKDIIPCHTTESVYSTYILLTDIVYIYQQELHDRLQFKKTGYRIFTHIEKLELLDIEYGKLTTAAAVILTAFCILNSSGEINGELCEFLSTICEMSTDNILTISASLLSIINSINL